MSEDTRLLVKVVFKHSVQVGTLAALSTVAIDCFRIAKLKQSGRL